MNIDANIVNGTRLGAGDGSRVIGVLLVVELISPFGGAARELAR